MKYLFLLCMLLGSHFIKTAYTGQWLNKMQQGNRIDYAPIRFYSETKPYTQEGILFTFPENYFTTSPHVHVSLQLNASVYNAQLKFHTFVTELSPEIAKVNVNKVNAGIIRNFTTEADTDEVVVHLFALGY